MDSSTRDQTSMVHMTKHYNTTITERALRILNSKGTDQLSDEVSGPVAVIPIVPAVTVVLSVTSATTILTTPTSKDFYLTAAHLSGAKLAADSGASLTLFATVAGVAQNILGIAGVTLTADAQTTALNFNPPIKIDRGTIIAASGAGFSTIRAGICGYTEEVTRT